MLNWWGDVIVEYYALTETGILTTCDSAQWRDRPGSVGRAAKGIEIRILKDDGSAAAPGEGGEICVRSSLTPHVSYYRDEAQTRRMRRGEFLATGDLGYLAEDGHLYVTGRKSEMVISGGVNIYPVEIEAALATCPGVRDCAVFGVPDDEYGERLVAVIQSEDSSRPPDSATVREFLSDRLARFKIPREIHFRADLPREDSGKIKKRLVRAHHLRHVP